MVCSQIALNYFLSINYIKLQKPTTERRGYNTDLKISYSGKPLSCSNVGTELAPLGMYKYSPFFKKK